MREGLHLRAVPMRVRFISIEPLLEDLGQLNLQGISWVIVGGESGPSAGKMDKRWVIAVREPCHDMGVPFFFKQWGGMQKSARGRRLQGKTYDEYPDRQQNPVLPDCERLAYASAIESLCRSFQFSLGSRS